MKYKHKLLIDHKIGGFVCGVLSLAARPARKLFRRDHSLRKAPRTVLFLKFVGLGSVCRSSFLIRACKMKYPESRIAFACFPECATLVGLYGQIDDLLVIRDKGLLELCLDTVKALVWCWSHRVDLVIDLEVHSKYSSIFAASTLSRDRAGFCYISSRFRRDLYTHLVYWNPLRHTDESYKQLAQALDMDGSSSTLIPKVPVYDQEKTQQLLDECGVTKSDRIVCVNVNAGPLSLERRWPAGSFAKTLSSIPKHKGIHIFLLGTLPEKKYVDSVLTLLSPERSAFNMHNIAGRLTLPMLVDLLKRSFLLLTNDSGPMHLAELLKTPTVSLWGPTAPALYGSPSENHKAFYQPLYCSPCVHITDSPPCAGDNQCLKRLPWQPVAREILSRLGYADTSLSPEAAPEKEKKFVAGYWDIRAKTD